MKNSYLVRILLVLTLGFFGCQTEELKPEPENVVEKTAIEENAIDQNFKVAVKNDMLSFATREDYDMAIEYLSNLGDENFGAWENSTGFTSMRSVFDYDGLTKRGINDPLLATIINPEGMIEISGNIFKLNMLTEKVSVIPSAEYGKSAFSSKNTRVFSTEDDVLDILDGSSDGESSESARRYCRSQRRTGSISVGGSRTTYTLEYRRAGFLNTLGAILLDKYNINGFIRTQGISFYKNKKVCRTENNRRSTNARRNVNIVRIYNSSRRLKAYNLNVKFTVVKNPAQAVNNVSVQIGCGTQVPCP